MTGRYARSTTVTWVKAFVLIGMLLLLWPDTAASATFTRQADWVQRVGVYDTADYAGEYAGFWDTPDGMDFDYWANWTLFWEQRSVFWAQPQCIAIGSNGTVYVGAHWMRDPGTRHPATRILQYRRDGTNGWCVTRNGTWNDGWWPDVNNQTPDYPNFDQWSALAVDSAGNVYATGYSHVDGRSVFLTASYDTNGVERWVSRYSEASDAFQGADAIALDEAGHVFVTGFYESNTNVHDVLTVMYDAGTGTQQWAQRFGAGVEFFTEFNYAGSLRRQYGPCMSIKSDGASYVYVATEGLLIQYAITNGAPGFFVNQGDHGWGSGVGRLTCTPGAVTVAWESTAAQYSTNGTVLWSEGVHVGGLVAGSPARLYLHEAGSQLTSLHCVSSSWQRVWSVAAPYSGWTRGESFGDLLSDTRGHLFLSGLWEHEGGGFVLGAVRCDPGIGCFTTSGTNVWFYPRLSEVGCDPPQYVAANGHGDVVTLGYGANPSNVLNRGNYNLGTHLLVEFLDADYLAADVTVDLKDAAPGELLTYTNALLCGPRAQTNVVVTLPVPSNTVYVSGGTLEDGSNIVWRLPLLRPEAQTNLPFVLRLDPAAPAEPPVEVWATVVSRSMVAPVTSTVARTRVYLPQAGAQQDVPYVSDPVHAGSGNLTYSAGLFEWPNASLPVRFTVAYNSQSAGRWGPLGYGWTHNYDVVLTNLSDAVRIRWGDGHEELFIPQADGSYTGRNQASTTLGTNGSGFVAATSDGTTYTFDSSGRLVAIGDRTGGALTFGYSGRELATLSDACGRSASFACSNGLLRSVQLSGVPGASCIFTCDTASNLTAVSDLRGNAWHFEYDGAHRMTRETDRRGVIVCESTYDARGRVATQKNAAGGVTTLIYGTNVAAGTFRTRIVAPDGNTTTQEYDANLEILRVTYPDGHAVDCAYDAHGNRLSASDKKGRIRRFGYDSSGNATSRTDRAGGTLAITYGAANRPTQVRDGLGNVTAMSYDSKGQLQSLTDPLGRTVQTAYNTDGTIQSVTDSRSNTWRMAYNAQRLLSQGTDPLGGQANYTYDAMGRVVTVSQPGDPVAVARMAYDANGNRTNLVDYLGYETRWAYDANGNRVSETYVPRGLTTLYAYDGFNRLTNIVNALGGHCGFEYDGQGQLVRRTDPDGVAETMDYDWRGLRVASTDAAGLTTRYAYDENGDLATITTPAGKVWRYQRDAEGRVTQVEDPAGGRQTFAYDVLGRVVSARDPSGRNSAWQYDAAGQVTAIIGPDGGMTRYGYDDAGNPVSFTDPRGGVWTLEYDALDRRIGSRNPLGSQESCQVDARGLLIRRTSRDGRVYGYTHDRDGRLTGVDLPDGEGTVSNTYDEAGNLVQMADAGGTNSMTYDLLNRKTSFTDKWGATLRYGYTPGGRLSAVTYPGEHTVSNAYDSAGRLVRVDDWTGRQLRLEYDALGRVTRAVQPNGTRTVLGYDALGRVATLRHETAGATLIEGYRYSYDAAGRISRRVRETPGAAVPAVGNASSACTYDAANRVLTQMAAGSTNRWSFDAGGNLLTNEVGGVTRAYTYDTRGRLTGASSGGTALCYAYDPAGERIAKVVNGQETRYLVDNGQVYCRMDGGGAVQRYYIHAGTMVYSLDGAGNIMVCHGDERGSIVALTDGAGAVVRSYAYSPYGEVLSSAGTVENEFQYLGAYGAMADESGLYGLHARSYEPRLGRFIREDPLGLTAGLNLYLYAAGDPINRRDPGGLSWTEEVWYTLAAFREINSPDYYSAGLGLNLGVTSVGGSVTVDRNYNVYISTAGGGDLGNAGKEVKDAGTLIKKLKPNSSVQVVAGYYRPDGQTTVPTDEQLSGFLAGDGRSYGAAAGVYVGTSQSSSGSSLEIGFGTGLNISESTAHLILQPSKKGLVNWNEIGKMIKDATKCPLDRAREQGYDVHIDNETGMKVIGDVQRLNGEKGHLFIAQHLYSGGIEWYDTGPLLIDPVQRRQGGR